MRIDLNHGPQAVPESGTANPQNTSRAASASSAIREDQAELSGARVQVQALAAQAAQLPEVRQERVSALRQALLYGQYHASPHGVAGAMFDHMLAASVA